MTKRPSLPTATALIGLLVVSGAVAATEPAIEPDTTVTSQDTDVVEDRLGATPIEPDPTVTDPRAQAWDHVVVAPDGMTLSVYFWMGVPECNGLRSVEISETDSGIAIALTTGVPAGAGDVACIEIAQLYVTTVTLEEPLITNVSG